jgi:AcrR family transcriptional regulator
VSGAPEDLRDWKLPRGRHGLPRELVTRSQRERLLVAVVRVVAANGYEQTTVADVLEEAGVGRESFYELFDSRRDCMLAAHALLVDDLEARVREPYLGEGPFPARMRAAVAAALDWFAEDPAAARFTLVELFSVGPPAREIFHSGFHRFVDLLDEGLDTRAAEPLSRATTLAMGAIAARTYEEVMLGRAAELPARTAEITYEMLVPFVGEAVAREAAEGGPEPVGGQAGD